MKQLKSYNEWEVQGDQLWQIYFNGQHYGTQEVSLQDFEDRFWQHYDHLLEQAHHSNTAPVKLPPQESNVVDRAPQDLENIFKKYWLKPQKVAFTTNTPQASDTKAIAGCFFQASFAIFSLVCLCLLAAKMFTVLFGAMVLMLVIFVVKEVIIKSESNEQHNTLLEFYPTHLVSRKSTISQQISEVHLPYQSIHTFWYQSAVLQIIGKYQQTTHQIIVPEEVKELLTIKAFIQEIVSYNYLKINNINNHWHE